MGIDKDENAGSSSGHGAEPGPVGIDKDEDVDDRSSDAAMDKLGGKVRK